MSLAETIERQIRAESKNRYGTLNLPEEWIAPNYGGCSILNIPATVVRAMGGEMPTPPLDAAITQGVLENVRRIVLVVVDALGYSKLLQTLAANSDNGLHALLRRGATLVPLTSVFPSTTVAALTTLWSGYSPAEHGFLGYQLFLRELGVRAEMILFSPVSMVKLGRDLLIAAGLEPEKFLAVPALPQTLAPLGVRVYHLLYYEYLKSGLSRVQIRGAEKVRGFITSADMWVMLREMLEQKKDERAVYAVYWAGVDGIGHTYGPSTASTPAEIDNLAYSFTREFLDKLSPAARDGTLFLLTADHGQIDTPRDRSIPLHEHPGLYSHLVMDFAGEPRAAYLYCRPGEKDVARQYVENELGDKFLVLDSRAVLEAGLFGSGTLAPEAPFRIGDLLLLPRADYTLVETKDVRLLAGRHGGLTADEMLVPLIVARLDA